MKSLLATPTTTARSKPLPSVWRQVIERVFWAAADALERSKVIAAEADEAAKNSAIQARRNRPPTATGRNDSIALMARMRISAVFFDFIGTLTLFIRFSNDRLSPA